MEIAKYNLPERFSEPKGWLWGQFENARGGTLRFGRLSLHKTPLAHIVYVEGLSEFAEKTFELARNFNGMACNFSVIDRYGQGKSTRYFSDAPHKQHSGGIDRDIDDLIRYCKENIPEDEPIVLLGHSTGGLIALLTVGKEPALFKAAILTAPLLGIKDRLARDKEHLYAALPFPEWLRRQYKPGGSDWNPRCHPDNVLSDDKYSSDPVRGKIHSYWTRKDSALRTGSPTIGWVQEICKAIVKTRAPSFAAAIRCPVLLFTAEKDPLANNAWTLRAAKTITTAEHILLPDSLHEPLMETDNIRNIVLTKSHDFLKRKL